MTPSDMSTIHQAAFTHERGWGADEFTALLAQPYTTAFATLGGFALTRTVAGESELLTLAVSPAYQRHGIASRLLLEWTDTARTQADTAFLEVAADNHGALALYTKHGFTQVGLRKAYYTRVDAIAVDAVLMKASLTQG